MNTDNIIRVLCLDWSEQRVEVMIRDGNVIRREWVPMAEIYVNPMEVQDEKTSVSGFSTVVR